MFTTDMSRFDQPDAMQAHDELDALQTALVDAVRGYETMLKKAEPSFKPVVQDLIDLHTQHIEVIAATVRHAGGRPALEGSFMGAVHETVVSARALFDRIDHDSIGGIVDGETRIVKKYDDAIAALPSIGPLTETVLRQKQVVLSTIRRLESKAPAKAA
jgi:hypothetical protein